MRRIAIAVSAVALLACRKKPAPADAASLAEIFAQASDAGAAPEPSASSTDEPLPSLKHVDVPPPAIGGKPKPTVSTAPTPAPGNPNLPECVVARAFCAKGKPECDAKKSAWLAAGGAM